MNNNVNKIILVLNYIISIIKGKTVKILKENNSKLNQKIKH